MPNYSTNLKTWGNVGQEYPDNYSYVEGEQPVDAWDNFIMTNVIDDIEHLIDVTNNELLARDGTVDLQADLSDDNANTIWDYTNGYVPVASQEAGDVTINAGDGLKGGGTFSNQGGSTTVDIEPSDFAGSGLVDDGSDNLEVSPNDISISAGDGLSGGGSPSLGGSTTLNIAPSDFAGTGISVDGNNDMNVSTGRFAPQEIPESPITVDSNKTVSFSNSYNYMIIEAEDLTQNTEFETGIGVRLNGNSATHDIKTVTNGTIEDDYFRFARPSTNDPVSGMMELSRTGDTVQSYSSFSVNGKFWTGDETMASVATGFSGPINSISTNDDRPGDNLNGGTIRIYGTQ